MQSAMLHDVGAMCILCGVLRVFKPSIYCSIPVGACPACACSMCACPACPACPA